MRRPSLDKSIVRRALALFGIGICALACASGGSPSRADQPLTARATLVVSDLAPKPGSAVNRNSIIAASIHYSMTGFDSTAAYILVPLFDKRDGITTFNMLPGFKDGLQIAAHEGDVRVTYPIVGEWDSGELAKPVVMHYVILQRTARRQSKSVGISEKFTFAASE